MAYLQITTLIKYVTSDMPIWVEKASDPNLLDFTIDCSLLPYAQEYSLPIDFVKYGV